MCIAKINDNIFKNHVNYPPSNIILPSWLQEDNDDCIIQTKRGFIKSDRTKHIFLKFFYIYELWEKCEINVVQHIYSCDNIINLFTKSLPLIILKKLRYNIGMRRLRDLAI